MVTRLALSSANAHCRAARCRAARQGSWQNLCCFPPSRRGLNGLPQQVQAANTPGARSGRGKVSASGKLRCCVLRASLIVSAPSELPLGLKSGGRRAGPGFRLIAPVIAPVLRSGHGLLLLVPGFEAGGSDPAAAGLGALARLLLLDAARDVRHLSVRQGFSKRFLGALSPLRE
jgi:hypothetical protein